MQVSRKLEQQIAVIGASGSGKTVLLSSFYGATQEPHYLQQNPFNVVADDIGQGSRLHQNYLGMRNSAKAPLATRFTATSYSFSIMLKGVAEEKATRRRAFDALRLVWHDYPGDWFEQEVSGPEEARRRIDTFRSLLGADVALLLVDGQRVLDHAGEEERYLKALFTEVRNSILSLKADLLEDGKPLVEFPRIWVLALSKADLLPDIDVFQFRDLVIEKAGGELTELRAALAGLVDGSSALSVGEDFVILSSAKFEAGRIAVTERIGVESILPLAAILPFERHVRWARTTDLPGKVGENLLSGAGDLAAVLFGRNSKVPGPLGLLLKVIGLDVLDQAARLAGDKLRELNREARERRDHLSAVLTQFKLDLDRNEENRVLLRSRK